MSTSQLDRKKISALKVGFNILKFSPVFTFGNEESSNDGP